MSGLRKVFDPRSDRSVFRCGFLVEFSMSDLQQAAVALPHDGVGAQKGDRTKGATAPSAATQRADRPPHLPRVRAHASPQRWGRVCFVVVVHVFSLFPSKSVHKLSLVHFRSC